MSGATTPDEPLEVPRRSRFTLGADLALSSRPPSPELAATPNLVDLRRSLSSKALRELDTSRLKAGIWRPPNEEPRHPKTFEHVRICYHALHVLTSRRQLYLHAALTALRSFGLAWGTRAAFNLVLTLLRAASTRRIRLSSIQAALLSKSATNFGRVFAVFVFVWKFAKEGLRLYNIGPRGKMQQERWHAAAAGALAGLCVLAEGEKARLSLAQQIFVRGLQGVANRASLRGLRVPNGNALVFAGSCSMIMGCFAVAKDALDPGYWNWILSASRAPRELLTYQLARIDGKPVPTEAVERVLQFRSITQGNATRLRTFLEAAKRGDHGPRFGPCEMHHPAYDSCLRYTIALWPTVFRWILPVYLGLNTLPSIVLRRKAWVLQPMQQIFKALRNTAYNCAFLATFVLFFQGPYCLMRQLHLNPRLPKWLRDEIVSKRAYFGIGFLTGISLIFEDPRRRTELAMYVLPKSLEACWRLLRKRAMVPHVPNGSVLLSVVGSAMLMDAWTFHRDALSGLATAILYQVLGPSC